MGLPFSMVGAMVVWSRAAPGEVAPICFTSSGLKSQALATAILMAKGAAGASDCSMSAPGPRKAIGKPWSEMAVTARERVTTPPPSAGGAEEWPPGALAVTTMVA